MDIISDILGAIGDFLGVIWTILVGIWDLIVNVWNLPGVIWDQLSIFWANLIVFWDQIPWDQVGCVSKYGLIGACYGALGIPFALGIIPRALGFSAGGIIAGSIASMMMAFYAGFTPAVTIADVLCGAGDLLGTTWTAFVGIWDLLVNDWNLPGVIKDQLRVVWANVVVYWDRTMNDWDKSGVFRNQLGVVWANVVVFWDRTVDDLDKSGVIRDRLSVFWAKADVVILRDQISWDHIGRTPKYGLIGACVGAIGLPLLIYIGPFVCGFRKKGISSRSFGSRMMSRYGGDTPGGGHVARMQSIGAKGFPGGFLSKVMIAGAVLGSGLGVYTADLLEFAEMHS
ncbi:hypothetical protein BGZ88_003687 [Linnemannia elongata]|nr:hypothetical protein BGZ88_003687 [Linnemannia elongata]